MRNAPEASKCTVSELISFFAYHILEVFETTFTATQEIKNIISIDKNGT